MFLPALAIICLALMVYGVYTVIANYPADMISFWYIFLIVFGTIFVGGFIYAMSTIIVR